MFIEQEKDEFDYNNLVELMWKSKSDQFDAKAKKRDESRRNTMRSPKRQESMERINMKTKIEELKKIHQKVLMIDELRNKNLNMIDGAELKARLYLK